MFKPQSSALILFAAVMIAPPVLADSHDPGINRHQVRQHARIAEGVKSGELTKDEAKDLHADEKQIRQEEHAAKADGNMTKAERAKILQDQRAASKKIYQEKHDAEVRAKPSN